MLARRHARVTTPWTDPTHSEAPAPRKVSRLGLYIPWGIALAAAIAWSLWWLVAMNQVTARLDETAATLRAAGWRVAWASRETGGYPFRLDVNFTGLVIADPSGWSLAAPALRSEAYAFAPTQWRFYAPGGRMTVTRPGDGSFDVTAGALRGSVSGLGEGVPNLALEGEDLRFTPGQGAAPVLLASAKSIQFYTRPGPNDQGAMYLAIDGGAAAPGSWLAAVASGGPVGLKADAIFGHASAFAGRGWRAAAIAWTQAGGGLDLQHLELDAGAKPFVATTGRLVVGDDGWLTGRIGFAAGPNGKPPAIQLDVHAPRLF
jgi:hypothetical protein